MSTRVAKARNLRKNSTDAEHKLWRALRDRRLLGFKFRRQEPIGNYIVDFFCPSRGLVVEVDGGQHADNLIKDKRRALWLEQQGLRVIRFWNNQVLQQLDLVLEEIVRVLSESSPRK